MMETDYEKIKEVLEEFPMGEDILESVEEYSCDEDFSYLYYDEEKNRRGLYNGSITEAKEEGIKESKLEIAKSMKKENIDINVISKCTGLTIEEIKKL